MVTRRLLHRRVMRQRRGRIAARALSALANAAFAIAPRKTTRLLAAHICTPSDAARRKASSHGAVSARVYLEHLDDRRIALYHWGDCAKQPYILASHGWAASGCWFEPWAVPLRQSGCALVAVDQRGHGRSERGPATVVDFACLLFAVASRLGPPAGLLGHSLGGLAAALALEEGFHTSRAVLVAPTVSVRYAFQRRSRASGLSDALRARLLAHLEKEANVGLQELDLRSCAPGISVPGLLVCDEGDDEAHLDEIADVSRRWAHSELLPTKGLGHRRILADDAVIAAGVRWLRDATGFLAPTKAD